MGITSNQAHNRVAQLYNDLSRLVEQDPEQEVQGVAILAIDAMLDDVAPHANGSLVERVRTIVTPEAIAAGDPVRAADLLILVGQLVDSIPMVIRTRGYTAADRQI